MQNRRKTKRHYLLEFVRVYNADTRQPIGNLVDITLGGARIVAHKPIAEGQAINLHLVLTSEVANIPFMEFPTVSKWCLPDLEPNLYNIGFEILELSAEDTLILQKIINTYGFLDNEPAK
jgi:hypothetical protein